MKVKLRERQSERNSDTGERIFPLPEAPFPAYYLGVDTRGTELIRAWGTGFTVLEMLLVLAITAILMIIGIPALQSYEMRQRMSAAMHLLHSHLVLARNEAVRANTQVVACPGRSDSGCAEAADWSAGWIVFADLNGDRRYQPGESMLRTEPGLERVVIRSTSGRASLRFSPNGSAPGSNSSIFFCDERGPANARKLVISNTGRIRRDEAPEIDASNCPTTTG